MTKPDAVRHLEAENVRLRKALQDSDACLVIDQKLAPYSDSATRQARSIISQALQPGEKP